VEELELHSNSSRNIHVTTTITKTESPRIEGDQEVVKKSSESETALKGENKWGANLETDSCEEVGSSAIIAGGSAV
jgi:hypothetical protein